MYLNKSDTKYEKLVNNIPHTGNDYNKSNEIDDKIDS